MDLDASGCEVNCQAKPEGSAEQPLRANTSLNNTLNKDQLLGIHDST